MGRKGCGNGSNGSLLFDAQYHVDAPAIMTISDSLVNPDEDTFAEERPKYHDMIKLVLKHDRRLMTRIPVID